MSATPPPVWGEVNLVGAHNAALEQSTLRILQGGSWKRQNVVMLLPAAKMVPMKCAVTWMHLGGPPNQALHKVPLLGMEVGDAYSQSVEWVLQEPTLKQCEYILTVEHDNSVPQDGLFRLLAQMEAHPHLTCIGGLYWTKGPAGVPQIWGDKRDPVMNFRPQPPVRNCQCGKNNPKLTNNEPDIPCQLAECWGTGMGFNLFRMSMFRDKRLPRPLFKTKASLDEGVGTQDLSFWGEAQKLGYRCAIDTSVLVGHYSVEEDFTW